MIDRELAAGAQDRHAGNERMARVCARRAAGMAVAHWPGHHPHSGWGPDAMSRLQALAEGETVPESVRAAARRLTTRVTGEFVLPFPDDPLNDGRAIVRYCLTEDEGSPGIATSSS